MSYKHYNPQNRIAARKMRRLIFAKMADVMDLCDNDAELDALEGHFTEHHHLDLLDGVHVYPGKGGWFCDLTFSGVPEHVAGLIGASETNPYAKREDAIGFAFLLMASIDRASKRRELEAGDAPVSVLEFDEMRVPIQKLTLDRMIAVSHGTPFPTTDSIRRRLLDMCDVMTGGERYLIQEDVDRLEHGDNLQFHLACSYALIVGIDRIEQTLNAAPRPGR